MKFSHDEKFSESTMNKISRLHAIEKKKKQININYNVID